VPAYAAEMTATARLTLTDDGRVRHRITPDELSNDLACWIADDLVAPGLIPPSAFERTFVSVVGPDWLPFYRNTLRQLSRGGTPGGTNAGMAPVHDRAAYLALGSVVELGCCFGFLSLRLARDGHRVTAIDLSPGTVALLASIAPALGTPLHALVGDAAAVPLADRSADTVLAVHLLEHLPPARAPRVIAEMLRVARRRVVVAVPYEDVPNPTWGHIRTFDPAALDALGAATGRPYTVDDHHGGWLVVDA
jgi:SAM-dependent methyltransferase